MSAAATWEQTCSACPTAACGGKCPRCDLYWYRGEQGKMVAVRWADLTAAGVTPTISREPLVLDDRGDPQSHDLGVAVALSKSMPPDLAEAVDGLVRLWNLQVRNLSGRQAQALILVFTRRSLSSLDLANLAKMSQQNASNTLAALVRKGLLKRVRNGVNLRYELAFVWPTGKVARAAQIAMRRLASATATVPVAPKRSVRL